MGLRAHGRGRTKGTYPCLSGAVITGTANSGEGGFFSGTGVPHDGGCRRGRTGVIDAVEVKNDGSGSDI